MNVYFRCAVGNGGGGGSDATLTVLGSATLAGITCTCTDGVTTLTQTFPSTSPYDITFNIPNEGTWTVSVIVDGITHSETVQISLNQTIDIGVFNLQNWLTEGRVTGTYSTLTEVLEDEATLRQLFLVHDSVDYLASRFIDSNIETIFNCDLAAKWINLSDYALDTFYAVPIIKALMDEADKYGYGEWALLPQVPKMTSNTAPYGTAFGSTNYTSFYPWLAFTQTTDKPFESNSVASHGGDYIGYKFVNPINVRKVSGKVGIVGDSVPQTTNITVKIQGSNDNSTWTDLTSEFICNYTNGFTANISNSDYYLYVRVYCVSGGYTYSRFAATMLQFYAWGPKGNVPVMTGNTSPYGEAIASSYISGNENYKAFDRYAGTYWRPNTTVPAYCGYKFTSPLCVKRVSITHHTNASVATREITHGKIQASNDNITWVDIVDDFAAPSATRGLTYYVDCSENSESYLYYRVYVTAVGSGDDNRPYIGDIQFYGRELKVSVPTMTSNTTPFGEAIGSSNITQSQLYLAFDGNTSTNPRYITETTNGKVGYKFTSPISVRKVMLYANYSSSTNISMKVQYSDDGTTWTDATTAESAVSSQYKYLDVANVGAHRYWCVNYTTATSKSAVMSILQFYGLDYSEKEFEVGTTKKWLYDHGVELEEIVNGKDDGWTLASSYTFGEDIVKRPSDIIITNTGSNKSSIAATHNAIDMTPYNTLNTIASAPYLRTLTCNFGVYTSKNQNGSVAVSYLLVGDTKSVLDISAVTQSCYVLMGAANGTRDGILKEFWLE